MTDGGTPPTSAAAPPPPSRRPLLSGEGDPYLLSRRAERLGGILGGVGGGGAPVGGPEAPPRKMVEAVGETTFPSSDSDGAGGIGGGGTDPPPSVGADGEAEGSGGGGAHDYDDDDDDEPPPIAPTRAVSDREPRGGGGSRADADAAAAPPPPPPDDPPSLMEEMMAEAAAARAAKEKGAKDAERRGARSASFGMRRGFLNGTKKGEKKKKATTGASSGGGGPAGKGRAAGSAGWKGESGGGGGFRKGFLDRPRGQPSRASKEIDGGRSDADKTEDDVFEIDAEGNLITASPPPLEADIPTVRPKDRGGPSTRGDALRLDEVQDALRNDPAERLLAGGEWATPDLLRTVAENPRLAAGLGNPKFAAALQALQENPREAMKRFKDHPEITDFLHEFCGVMGEHFTKLGAEQDGRRVEDVRRTSDLGPMAEAALEREADRIAAAGRKGRTTAGDEGPSREERERMDAVLADGDLTAMLMDPEMQRVMQECALPGRMRAYMGHPEYGAKLRRLIDAGLLRVER